MRVPVDWLSEYLDIKGNIEDLADKLTMAGLEVEEITAVTQDDLVKMGGVPDGSSAPVLITKVTPNRGDWLSVIGVAREAAACTKWHFSLKKIDVPAETKQIADQVEVRIDSPDLCRRYAAMLIRNVVIKDSPNWMKNRLVRAGMRPINNIVDITNYVMLEYGQPLHAFDYDLLIGGKIIVRRAKQGETIMLIDGTHCELDDEMMVIADEERAVAIAGVMGGADTEVNEKTVNVLLESANFNPVSIRRTSKALGISTEASYRFERSVDVGITDEAAVRAAELMKELAEADIVQGIIDVFPGKTEPAVIEVRPERANNILGLTLDTSEMVECLQRLGISVENGKSLKVTVPSWRPDITSEIDVIEEIARIHGYEDIPETLPCVHVQGKDSAEGQFCEKMRQALMSCGLQEVLTHSLTDPVSVEISGLEDRAISIRNPLSEDTSKLRTMLSPGLLQTALRNQSFGIRDMGLFEIGKIYLRDETGAITESRSAAGLLVGSQWDSVWSLDRSALIADYYWGRGVVEAALERLGFKDIAFRKALRPMLHKTRSAEILVRGVEIGWLGEAAPEVTAKIDMRGRPVIFEINVDKLFSLIPEAVQYRPAPKFPALYLNLAFVFKKGVPYESIERVIKSAGGSVVEDVSLVDVYTGQQIDPNERSLTLAVAFRSEDRTLKDEEVEEIVETIKSRLSSELGARLRG